MDRIQFIEEKVFLPYIACIPGSWSMHSFDNLDFTGKEKLKEFILHYFEHLEYKGRDSLLLNEGNFAFKLFISIYKEIGSYIPVDTCKFLDWAEYSAKIKGLGYKGSLKLVEDLSSANFVFIFDLFLNSEDTIKLFQDILSYTDTRKIKVFGVTRMSFQEVKTALVNIILYDAKIIQLGIKEV
jgi:hypothetical protein